MEKGYIHIYTGSGKGKTTAALGLALRAAGAGLSVYFAQFLKKGSYSEISTLTLLSENTSGKQKINTEQFGTGKFIIGKPDKNEIEHAAEGYQKALKIMQSGEYDLVILDEAVSAYSLGLLSEKDIGMLISSKKENTELILTGRGCDNFLENKADLVTEMKEIKHYYNSGTQARIGIEY